MRGKTVRRRATANGILLRLYIAGDGPNSTEARANLQAFLTRDPERTVTLEVIDVLVRPDEGLRDAVVVTPTLIRVRPPPERRIIGNLRDRTPLLTALVWGGEDHE